MNNGIVKWFNNEKDLDLYQWKVEMTYLLISQLYKLQDLNH